MHENYDDIKSRIQESPTWYDRNGTPRYGEFHPSRCPNIYASQIGLFLITCQDCKQEFRVEIHANIFGDNSESPPAKWHYGDPPVHGCVGDTMNCDDLAVLQFWTNNNAHEWERRNEFEGKIDES